MATKLSVPPHVLHLGSERVRGMVEGILRQSGVPRVDIEDLRQDVLVQTLSRPIDPPTPSASESLACKIARDMAVNYHRHDAVRARADSELWAIRDQKPPSTAPEHAFDRRLQIAWLLREIGSFPPRCRHILLGVAAGASTLGLARELGVRRGCVRRDLRTTRAHLRASWAGHLRRRRLPLRSRPLFCTADRRSPGAHGARGARSATRHRPTPIAAPVQPPVLRSPTKREPS